MNVAHFNTIRKKIEVVFEKLERDQSERSFWDYTKDPIPERVSIAVQELMQILPQPDELDALYSKNILDCLFSHFTQMYIDIEYDQLREEPLNSAEYARQTKLNQWRQRCLANLGMNIKHDDFLFRVANYATQTSIPLEPNTIQFLATLKGNKIENAHGQYESLFSKNLMLAIENKRRDAAEYDDESAAEKIIDTPRHRFFCCLPTASRTQLIAESLKHEGLSW